MAIRKDANTLSPAERQEFINAVYILKQSGFYDQLVRRHANAPMSAIHRSPAFLPWHRRFIFDFERELQRVSGNPNLGLPYWNWPSGGSSASMWNDDLLGGDGNPSTGIVESGPFRAGQWSIINSSGATTGPLRRLFGRSGASSLPTQSEINQVLSITPYDNAPWSTSSEPSFRNQLEGWMGPNLHNRGHVWVGGSMSPMTSPNDPVFFMHHCMVDKLWHEWQLRFPNQGYLPVSGGQFGQNLTDPMAGTPNSSVGSRPIDMLDSNALGIEYDQLLPGTPQSPPSQNIAVLVLNTPPSNSRITQPGEIDLFEFKLDRFSQVTLETSGDSDTMMTLFGPDNPTQQVAFNDDGGSNFNSRISMALSAGTYQVSIRLYNSGRTGNYRIQLSSDTSTTPTPTIPILAVNDPALNAEIATDQESDPYQITIEAVGSYLIETRGTTDMFLSLFGPNSQTTLIARDDDSGIGLNSRLTLQLDPGLYYANVRHYSTFGRGAYQISITSL